MLFSRNKTCLISLLLRVFLRTTGRRWMRRWMRLWMRRWMTDFKDDSLSVVDHWPVLIKKMMGNRAGITKLLLSGDKFGLDSVQWEKNKQNGRETVRDAHVFLLKRPLFLHFCSVKLSFNLKNLWVLVPVNVFGGRLREEQVNALRKRLYMVIRMDAWSKTFWANSFLVYRQQFPGKKAKKEEEKPLFLKLCIVWRRLCSKNEKTGKMYLLELENFEASRSLLSKNHRVEGQ